MIFISAGIDETRSAGATIAAVAQPGSVYALDGDLGCGKTEFVRGFVNHYDSSIIVRSPSFSIVNIYQTPEFPVYHFDFYRLADAAELFEIGFDDYINSEGICLIEWASMFPSVLPSHTSFLHFTDEGDTSRKIVLDIRA